MNLPCKASDFLFQFLLHACFVDLSKVLFNQRVIVGAPATQPLSNPRPRRPSARALWNCEPARTLMQVRCRPGSGVRSGWRDLRPSCGRPASTPPWRRRRWTSCGRRGRLSSSCAPPQPQRTSRPWASCSGPGVRTTVPPAAGARACCTRSSLRDMGLKRTSVVFTRCSGRALHPVRRRASRLQCELPLGCEAVLGVPRPPPSDGMPFRDTPRVLRYTR